MQPWNDAARREDLGTLHEEINGLPHHERTAIVLCDLEGMPPRDAARQLRWAFEQFEWFLLAGRSRLQSRMLQRGCKVPVARLAADCVRGAGAPIPRRLIDLAVQLAIRNPMEARTRAEEALPDSVSAASIARERGLGR